MALCACFVGYTAERNLKLLPSLDFSECGKREGAVCVTIILVAVGRFLYCTHTVSVGDSLCKHLTLAALTMSKVDLVNRAEVWVG